MHLPLHFQRIIPAYPLQRHTSDDAVDTREQSAALAPFRWHQPSVPLHKIVNSAVSAEHPVLPAHHFSGKNDTTATTDKKEANF